LLASLTKFSARPAGSPTGNDVCRRPPPLSPRRPPPSLTGRTTPGSVSFFWGPAAGVSLTHACQ
jgi:hypothetical protein